MAAKPTTTPAVFGPPPSHPFVDDPGGVFATDAHRRVLGHLPTPGEERTSYDLLYARIDRDGGNPLASPLTATIEQARNPGSNLDVDAVTRIVGELEAEGYVTTDNGLRMTDAGFDAITGGTNE